MRNKAVEKIGMISFLVSVILSFTVMPVNATTNVPNATLSKLNIATNSTNAVATGTDGNGFTWETVDGESYTITGYSGSDTNITIPSSIDGHIVTKIGDSAFKDKALTSVIIPDTVTSIGNFAFYYNTSLVSVTIPNSVTSIGDSAFAYCTSLESITLPINLQNIGNSTFQDCKALKAITIPNSVKSIGNYAFLECFSLTSITIPDGVTYIGEGAFKDCKDLKSVYMPDSVTSVGNYLFYNNQQLVDVRLSNNLTDTGSFMFYNCFSLQGVTLPSNLKVIGNSAFENCTSLKTITIPNGVARIGYRAFIMDTLLENVTIPNTVEIIDFNAFAHCYSFTNIVIPNSVKSIGDYAFYYDTNLTEITIPKSVTEIGFLTFDSTNQSFKIKGYGGSYAQNYAGSNSILFEELPITKYIDVTSLGTGTMTDTSIEIKWQENYYPSPNWTKVNIYRDGKFIASVPRVTDATHDIGWNNFTDTNLDAGTTYNYVIKSADATGDESSSSTAAIAVTTTGTYTAPKSNFSDVETDFWGFTSIRNVFKNNWMVGTPDGNFHPSNQMTRAEVATAISRLLNTNGISTTSSFGDVPKNSWYYSAISVMANEHLMNGTSSSTFDPNRSITRGEVAVILNRALATSNYNGTSMFTDIQDQNKYDYQAIVNLGHNGYFLGCNTNQFCENNQITRAEVATLLDRTGALIKDKHK